MVPQKSTDSLFNFLTDSLSVKIKDGNLYADNTTLGADNGIGVAAMLAILDSKDIQHPLIEALFTVDEEIGMIGSLNLQPDFLKSTMLLNLDTENDEEFSVSCAGGVMIIGSDTFGYKKIESEMLTFKIEIDGLKGGHSGLDIHMERANANKLMARLLKYLSVIEYDLIAFVGGDLFNAIPRSATIELSIDASNEKRFLSLCMEKKITVFLLLRE